MTTKTKTVAYIRVSTDKQAEHGISLEAQKKKVEMYAELHELDLVEVVCDAGVSAKTLNRPGLRRVLDMLDSGAAEGLLVVKLDRLTRSLRDWQTLIDDYFCDKAGKLLFAINDSVDTRTAAGRMVLNVLMSVNQWMREDLGEKTSQALQHKRSQGEYTGGRARYGFTVEVNGKLVENPAEQETISAAKALKKEGLSLRKIAKLLADTGRFNRDGKRFGPQSVALLVSS